MQTPGRVHALESAASNLVHIETAMDAPVAGVQIATVNRGSRAERLANALRIAAGWNLLDAAEHLLASYAKAYASQENNGPDAKLMTMANYGEQALILLQQFAKATGAQP